jgi:hypothetical protein
VGWVISNALMNSLCSPEQAGESLVAVFWGGVPWEPSNSTPTPQAYLCNVKTTEFCRLSRFGMKFGVLTESRGEELLTLYLEGFPAKTSPLQETATDSTENDPGCGWKCPGSLAKYDPASRSWRTRQHSLLGGLEQLSETWPRWGMTVDGELSPLPTLVPHTVESGSGLLPTPQASDNRNRGTLNTPAIARRIEAGKQVMLSMTVDGPLNPEWTEWLMAWPIGWTDLQPLEMDKFQEWLELHGLF